MARKISRKRFFKLLQGTILFFLGTLWVGGIRRHRTIREGKKEWTINDVIPEGIMFSGPVIVSGKNSTIRVFSSACPHLGCRIDRIKDQKLVCPCHGSEFSPEGINLKGPANRSLKELSYRFDKNSGDLVVDLEPER